MILSFFRQCILFIITLLILSLVSYAILLQDPLNASLASPSVYAGHGQYLQTLLQGDLGISYNGGASLRSLIFTVLPPTLQLCFSALLLAVLFGIPLGIVAAICPHHFIGKTIRSLTVIGLSVPVFWLAPIALYFSAIHTWEISAVGQYHPLYEIKAITGFPVIDVWFSDVPYRTKIVQSILQHLVLPSLVLSILPTMEITRTVQQRAEYVLNQNYVKIASTRGWSTLRILHSYVIRNTLPLLVPRITRLFTLVLTQCMLVENTLSWSGIGRWLIDAVNQQDYNSISAGIIVIGLCIIVVNLLVKLLMFSLDPFNKKNWYAK